MENLTFDALASALEPLRSVGQDEITFQVKGVPVTMRVALPEEENDVQAYALEAMPRKEEEDPDPGAGNRYIDRFKLATLSYAIVGIGDVDFRGVTHVETNEVLNNGMKVRISRHEAMRQIIHQWTGILRTRLFKKYSELLVKVERDAEDAIEYAPSDLDTEIERIEERLNKLKDDRELLAEQRASGVFGAQVDGIVKEDQGDQKGRESNMGKILVNDQKDKIQHENPVGQSPPTPIPEYPPHEDLPGGYEPPRIPGEVAAPNRVPPPKRHPNLPPLSDSSFVDTSDSDALQAEMEAETQRFLTLRTGGAVQVPESALNQVHQAGGVQRRPPHLGDRSPTHRPAEGQPPPVVHQAESFQDDPLKRPPEILEKPSVKGDLGDAAFNSQSAKGTSNPRFQKPKT